MKHVFLISCLICFYTFANGAESYSTSADGTITFYLVSPDKQSSAVLQGCFTENTYGAINIDSVYVNSKSEKSTDEHGGKAESLYGKSEIIISSTGDVIITANGKTGGVSEIKSNFAESKATRTQEFSFDGKNLTVTTAAENVSAEGYTAAYKSADGRYAGAEVEGTSKIGSNDFRASMSNQGMVTAKSTDKINGNYIMTTGNAMYNTGPNQTGFAKTEAFSQMGTDKNGGVWATGYVRSTANTNPNKP